MTAVGIDGAPPTLTDIYEKADSKHRERSLLLTANRFESGAARHIPPINRSNLPALLRSAVDQQDRSLLCLEFAGLVASLDLTGKPTLPANVVVGAVLANARVTLSSSCLPCELFSGRRDKTP